MQSPFLVSTRFKAAWFQVFKRHNYILGSVKFRFNFHLNYQFFVKLSSRKLHVISLSEVFKCYNHDPEDSIDKLEAEKNPGKTTTLVLYTSTWSDPNLQLNLEIGNYLQIKCVNNFGDQNILELGSNFRVANCNLLYVVSSASIMRKFGNFIIHRGREKKPPLWSRFHDKCHLR